MSPIDENLRHYEQREDLEPGHTRVLFEFGQFPGKILLIIIILASGIDVGPMFINFGFFYRPYGLIREYIMVI